jgi:thiamine-monophosphate kinase
MAKKHGKPKPAPGILGEDGIIELVRRQLDPDTGRVLLGAGADDCAVISGPGGDTALLFTTDAMVQDVHFRLDWSSPYQVGWKALAAAVSDIGAMGGRPLAAVAAVGLTGNEKESTLRELARGMNAAGRLLGCPVAGGDTVRSPRALSVTVSVIGEAGRDAVITRKGARPGDVLLLIGDIGAAAAGFEVLRAKDKKDMGAAERRVVQRHLAPEPPVAAGRIAAAAGGVTAMMDLSDGLAADLPRLCARSGVGAVVRAADLPIHPDTARACRNLGLDSLAAAVSGGEDYALLLAAHPDRCEAMAAAVSAAANVTVTIIGEVTDQARGLVLLAPDGNPMPWPEPGFKHF